MINISGYQYTKEELKALEKNKKIVLGLTKEQRSYLDWILENINHSREVGLYFNAYTSLIHCEQLSKIIFELVQNKHLF